MNQHFTIDELNLIRELVNSRLEEGSVSPNTSEDKKLTGELAFKLATYLAPKLRMTEAEMWEECPDPAG